MTRRKFLILGNSQAGALKSNSDTYPSPLGDHVDLFFSATASGIGPLNTVQGDRLHIEKGARTFHMNFFVPPQTPDMALNEFDDIMIGAIGYVDGGFSYKNDIPVLGALWPYRPLFDAPLVSADCYEPCVIATLETHPGIKLARALRPAFRGRIFIQPFPYPAAWMADREDWIIRRSYGDPLGFHAALINIRNRFLARLAVDIDAQLVPVPAMATPYFSDSDLMLGSDGIHGNGHYGGRIFKEVAALMAR